MNISVIVPIYGVERYIDKSLRSLFSQTKTDGVEFILVNDCTPDSSIEIAKDVIAGFPNLDVKIVKHEGNRGLAASRQTGMDCAKGDYVIHIDSDDWCELNMLEDMYAKAKETDADIVGCDFYITYLDREVYSKQILSNIPSECIEYMLCGKLYGSVWNKLYRREVFVNNNITWVEGLDMCEDLLINSKLFPFVKTISYLPKAYVHYMQRDDSYVSTMSEKSIKSVVRVVEGIKSYYASIGIIDKYNESLLILKNNLKLGMLCNSKGDKRKQYAALYPDAKEYVFKCKTRNIIWYIALYLTYYSRFELLDILLWCGSIKKRLK